MRTYTFFRCLWCPLPGVHQEDRSTAWGGLVRGGDLWKDCCLTVEIIWTWAHRVGFNYLMIEVKAFTLWKMKVEREGWNKFLHDRLWISLWKIDIWWVRYLCSHAHIPVAGSHAALSNLLNVNRASETQSQRVKMFFRSSVSGSLCHIKFI